MGLRECCPSLSPQSIILDVSKYIKIIFKIAMFKTTK